MCSPGYGIVGYPQPAVTVAGHPGHVLHDASCFKLPAHPLRATVVSGSVADSRIDDH